jgi:erythronate-4-phosphate dehydrogenase
MKIVVDQNIPLGNEAFADAGEVVRLPGRNIQRQDLDGCHALIVRSITKVNRSLLEGTPVRFVGTCTIGTDHLEIPWLEQNGIRWVSAPGCNARSVAEWVGAVLASAHLDRRIDLSKAPGSGVIGVGRVGRQVAQVLTGLVGEPLLNDPPRALAEGPRGFASLTDLVQSSSIVCAHLPLTRTGDHATIGLLSRRILSNLPQGAIFLNAGRGPTAVSDDLLALLEERPDLTMALDVFDPEPSIPPALARKAHFISPHVAGYSLEGKLEGTRMVREALGEFLGLSVWKLPSGDTSPLDVVKIRLPDGDAVAPDSDPWDALCALIQAAWSPLDDDERLRACLGLQDIQRGEEFDRLRKEYPIRREWRHRPLANARLLPKPAFERARELGFRES